MKTLLLFLAFILPCASSRAQKISTEEALAKANRFMYNTTSNHHKKTQAGRKLVLLEESQLTGCYVFTSSDEKGFVIVGDGSAGESQILGWSDTDRYNADNVPLAMKEWITRQGTIKGAGASKGNVVVEPLLKTTWGQDDYFSLLCPTVNDKQCAAGCVAVSLAQVMYYYRWPETGAGSISYFDQRSNQQVSVDFSKSTYNWDAMPVKYDYYNPPTQEQQLAVATLVRDAGAACQMMYSPSASAAVVQLQNCYKYLKYTSTARYLYRSNCTATEWKDAIETELNAGRPVLYGGYSETRGHSFVADGYDDQGYLHINWGWNGDCNGYFLSNDMSPWGATDDGYNLSQNIIVGFMPDKNWSYEDKEEKPSQTFKWNFNDDGGVLTISGTGEIPYTASSAPWKTYKDKVKKVIINYGITNVPDNMFSNWYSITELELPSSLESIGEYAFYSCKLTSVAFPSKLKKLGSCAFYGNNLQDIYIPASLTDFDGSAFGNNSKVGAYVVDRDNPKFSTEDHVLYDKDFTTVISCPSLNESIAMPSTVTAYGSSAFYGCRFTTFTIPETITQMGESAFSEQPLLQQLIFHNDIKELPVSSCAWCYKLESVDLPDHLESIRDWAFMYNTSLTSITLPATLKTISYQAFRGCEQLSRIQCLATTAPLDVDISAFKDIASSGVLVVPTGSDYSSWLTLLPAGWKIEYGDFSDIEAVKTTTDHATNSVQAVTYNLQGLPANADKPGIYIRNGYKYWNK